MSGNLASQWAIRSIMRALPTDVAQRALTEMEEARRANTNSCESYDLGVIISAIKADLGLKPCQRPPVDQFAQMDKSAAH